MRWRFSFAVVLILLSACAAWKALAQDNPAPTPKLTYMDDILPSMWFPRDQIPTPEWLKADTSERKPMSWALWYSSVARYVAGHKDIMLVVLAKENRFAEARRALIDADGNIQFELSDIGFFRALVPLSAMSRIYSDPSVEEVESAAYSWGGLLLDSSYRPITDVRQYETLSSRYLLKRLPPTGDPAPLKYYATQAIFNPQYFAERTADRADGFIARNRPEADLGLEELRRTHPSFDGRGVSVGVYDYLPQLNHPAFGGALDIEGKKIPKFPRLQLDPSTFTNSLSVFTFHKPSPSENRSFATLLSSLAKTTVLVAEARLDREYADTIKAVFDPATRRFGFDIDKDGRLGPTEWFRDYRTAPSESVLYTTQFPTGSKQSAVFFLFTDFAAAGGLRARFVLEWMHGTMSAGVIGAAGGVSLRAMGLAPAAQIVPYSIPGTLDLHYDQVSSSLDLLLSAILTPDVDIVTAQAVFRPSEDNSYGLAQKAIERALGLHPKAVFMSSMNDTSSIDGHFGNAGVFARGVTAIGASVGPTVGSALFGLHFGQKTIADPVTSIGPASDGARDTLLFATSRYPHYTSCVPGDVALRSSDSVLADRMPHCTWLAFATSGATPPAAAVAASLFSGLRQHGYTGDSTIVVKALVASAESLDYSTYDYIAGQIDSARAWDWLEKNVLSKPVGAGMDHSQLQEAFETKAPIRHEESLRTGRSYSGRGMYDRYFKSEDVGKCTSIWVRSSSRNRLSEHQVKISPSNGPVVLATTRLTGSNAWQPITLCVAAAIESVWSGTVGIHGVASETEDELQIPVTIVAPVKLRLGQNSLSSSTAHFGMLREAFASLPISITPNVAPLFNVAVTPRLVSNRPPILDWVTMNGSDGTLQTFPPRAGVQNEAGLLVRTRWLNMPTYPAADFLLADRRAAVVRPDRDEVWAVSVNAIESQGYTQLTVSKGGPCSEAGKTPTLLFRAGDKNAVTDLSSACLAEIDTEFVSFTSRSIIDSLLILKPQPMSQYEVAVFRYHNGIWLPQISSFHSIWKTHEELKDLPPGEWRIFKRHVGPVRATKRDGGKVEPK